MVKTKNNQVIKTKNNFIPSGSWNNREFTVAEKSLGK